MFLFFFVRDDDTTCFIKRTTSTPLYLVAQHAVARDFMFIFTTVDVDPVNTWLLMSPSLNIMDGQGFLRSSNIQFRS
jgi:hypothetical protein